jgi:hypothetical protein
MEKMDFDEDSRSETEFHLGGRIATNRVPQQSPGGGEVVVLSLGDDDDDDDDEETSPRASLRTSRWTDPSASHEITTHEERPPLPPTIRLEETCRVVRKARYSHR